MDQKTYHHGELRQQLIDEGLSLINESGVNGLSIRKVAERCGVSHTAPYRHFTNKDELIQAIGQTVWTAFSTALMKAMQDEDEPGAQIVKMGVCYVQFLVEHPAYRYFIFSSDQAVPIKIGPAAIDSSVEAFNVFRRCALNYLATTPTDTSDYPDKIVLMWSTVHGMAQLIANGNLVYDGDELDWVESMLALYLQG
ncbi:TetR/AcrR family transcriptional regulator [Exiguobacterium alkaliphilum]|uniref:TetR/AcrR family transcriptional regulator n=1 Tax=Exiguobacterium alkaliphilum TaxID=1428684 RepID=A0ABT2KXH1_9BACL|nr:TetR/AcrR family transcriptional regulator [Exiguobacterium alkaliphilum]MCT4795634.1 TetR/AcrR family transcriptional regulator [Exiguobacterium alkaliphilum]